MSSSSNAKPLKVVNKTVIALTAYPQFLGDPTNLEELQKKINRYFAQMVEILFKKKDGDESDSTAFQLANEIGHSNLIMLGLDNLLNLSSEQRKQFAIIFTGSIAQQSQSEHPVATWIQNNPTVIDKILSFYDHPELAVCTGEMLRQCARYEGPAKELLTDQRLDKLFTYFFAPNFDVSADSFATFRELLLNAPQAEEFLKANNESIIKRLHSTLIEENYAMCRQTLKLIGEIIITYQSFQETYLADPRNLMVIMDLMASSYHNISMEAFHVFKLFVVNEHKPESIVKILRANAEKLIPYINDLLGEVEDEDLKIEKDYLLMQLGMLIPK